MPCESAGLVDVKNTLLRAIVNTQIMGWAAGAGAAIRAMDALINRVYRRHKNLTAAYSPMRAILGTP